MRDPFEVNGHANEGSSRFRNSDRSPKTGLWEDDSKLGPYMQVQNQGYQKPLNLTCSKMPTNERQLYHLKRKR